MIFEVANYMQAVSKLWLINKLATYVKMTFSVITDFSSSSSIS